MFETLTIYNDVFDRESYKGILIDCEMDFEFIMYIYVFIYSFFQDERLPVQLPSAYLWDNFLS